jgi:RNA recognition motif-containing protein
MSVEQVTEGVAAVNIGNGTTANPATDPAQNEAVIAVVEEGRRLYIGNLAYATSEGDLNDFFKGYLV